MTNSKNIIIPITKEARKVLDGIKKKYELAETRKEIVAAIRAKKPFKMNLVVRFTRDLILKKISNKEFLDSLCKELGISKEVTKNLAIDIMHELVPLLEKIPEDQLEEYNRKKSDLERKSEEVENLEEPEESESDEEELKKEEFKKAKEGLLEKLRATVVMEEPAPEPENPTGPNLKKVEVSDVEKNAAAIKHMQERKEAMAPEEKPAPRVQEDKYKEPI